MGLASKFRLSFCFVGLAPVPFGKMPLQLTGVVQNARNIDHEPIFAATID